MRKILSLAVIIFMGATCILFGGVSSYAEEGASLSKMVQSLQKSFDETIETSQKIQDENTRLKNENGKLSVEIAKLKEKSGEQEIKRLKKIVDEQNVKLELYFNRMEKLQVKSNELEAANQELSTMKTSIENSKDYVKQYAVEMEKMGKTTGKLHYNLGNQYFEEGEYVKAAKEYEEALKYLPNDSDVNYNLAIVYDFYLHDGEKAEKCYKKHLIYKPDTELSDFVKERIAASGLKAKVID